MAIDDMKGKYDRMLCDPPFLSPDCQTKGQWPIPELATKAIYLLCEKAAMTVRWLSKTTSTKQGKSDQRTIICTGERMESLVLKLYQGIKTTTFDPQHAQNRLSNDFRCYASFVCDSWSWR